MTRVLSITAVLLSACIAPQPVLRPVTGDEVTIFVHGYRGSFLATESGEIAWITISQGLSTGDRSLALPFEGQRDFPKYGPLHTTGPLTRLTAIPGLLEQDPYASWMDWAKDDLPGFTIFAYDWRQDVRASGDQLCAFIEGLGLGPKKRVNIVAHSMGGLVTLHCLRSGSDAVRSAVKKVVFAGTPFRGSPGAWDDLHLGTTSQSNTRLIDREALLTFSSTWQLLPPQADYFVDAQGAPTVVPALDPAAWQTKKWGLFNEPLPGAYVEQLRARVDAHHGSWAVLADVEGPAPTWKTMAVVGKGRPTITAWRVRSDGSFDFDQPVRGDGDGTVPAASTHPPKPIVATIVETTAEHSEMLRRREVQAVIAEFLRAP